MIHNVFKKTKLDEEFYNEFLKDRLPKKLIDCHAHLASPEATKNIPKETIDADWALQCATNMTVEQANFYYRQCFPEIEVDFLALPFFCMGVDLKANNEYLSSSVDMALMAVHPSWDAEYCEMILTKNNFTGFKPYPALVTNVKGAEISIFDFITHEQLRILDKHKKILTLHLPRQKRIHADENVYELKLMRDKYPDIKIIIAHFGRSFCRSTLLKGFKKLGDYINSFYYDTTAVINPDVYKEAFYTIDHDKIVYGTDFPLLLWHGKRIWIDEEEKYINLCREDLPWNKHIEGKAKEEKYTLFVYEQLKSILDAASNDRQLVEKLFYKNAECILNKN